MSPFGNPARKDGLLLRHWKKKEHNASAFPATPADSNAASEVEQDDKIQKSDPEYFFARYNVKLERPEYTDQEYETHLKSDDWDRRETDYLVGIVMEYDLRWPLIYDRYEYQPAEMLSTEEDSMALTMQPKQRSMEDIKTRYYAVAARTMVLHQPLSSMSNEEFELHEKMTKYNPVVETTRKKLAEVLQARSKEDVEEENILLAELQRITLNQERFFQERKELYDRLEAPVSTSGISMYHSSEELLQLMKTLLNADKNKKNRSLTDGAPATNPSNPNFSNQAERNQRHSISGPEKRQSVSGTSGQRQLSAREETKFGVSHHDRLTAGVQFRHEKITKLSQAKSNVQATKISAALTELNIPPRLVMPTSRVVNEYERLIQSIHTLLDVRKVSEKIEAEIKVLRAQREDAERKDGGAGVETVQGTAMEETKVEEPDDEAVDEEEDDDDEDDDEEEEAKEEDKDADEEEKDADDEEKEDDEDEEEEEDDDDDPDDDPDDDIEEDPKPHSPTPTPTSTSRRPSAAPSVRSNATNANNAAATAAATRKRSASVMSLASNKSSKRARK